MVQPTCPSARGPEALKTELADLNNEVDQALDREQASSLVPAVEPHQPTAMEEAETVPGTPKYQSDGSGAPAVVPRSVFGLDDAGYWASVFNQHPPSEVLTDAKGLDEVITEDPEPQQAPHEGSGQGEPTGDSIQGDANNDGMEQRPLTPPECLVPCLD